MSYASSSDLSRSIAELLRPPRRISISEFAAKSVKVNDGNTWDFWKPDVTPYMPEPMNLLTSRQVEAVIMAKPARTGGSVGLLDCWIGHSAACNPGDMAVYFTDEKTAQDYGRANVIRMHEESPDLGAMLSKHAHDNNITITKYRHGMLLRLLYPTSSNLSRITLKSVAITEYDSMRDTGDEGSIYVRAKKRVQNAMSSGMIAVESQPKRLQNDSKWRAATPHEAPPTEGSSILGLYNQGDKRMWYWCCKHCEGRFKVPPIPEFDAIYGTEESAATARVTCPHCGGIHFPADRRALNLAGRWIPEWYIIEAGNGSDLRDIPDAFEQRGKTASFWLLGCAAAYQSWGALVSNYLTALRKYEATGDETDLAATTNTDQGMPYLSRHLAEESSGIRPEDRAEDLPRYVVPDQARFVIASVDVQGGTKGRFVVQVHAIGPGMEQWIIDRYAITESPRGEGIQIDPAGYPEDWDALTSRVINATYRTSGEYELRTLLTVIDSGGEAGVTANAYAWHRRIAQAGMQSKVMLVKGASTASDSPIRKANARDVRGKPLRDVPLAMVNTNLFKDVVASSCKRQDIGPGYMHFPEWLPDSFYDELAAEVRDKNGKWKKVRARNEALDLWVYVLAGCWKLGAHKLKWDKPPPWAMPVDENSQRVTADERRDEQAAKKAAPKPPPPRRARTLAKDDWSSRL